MHRSRLSYFATWVAISLAGASIGCKAKEAPKAASAQAKALSKGAKGAKAAKTHPVFDVPRDTVYAASAHLRIVDAAAGQVVAGIDMQRAISTIAFTKDGARAFVAASDGVREIDAERREVVAKLTQHPARTLRLSADESRLFVLEHEVVVQKNGVRDVKPFRLVTVDLAKRAAVGRVEVGYRILTMIPATAPGRHHVIVRRSGKLTLVQDLTKLEAAKQVDLDAQATDNDPIFGFRPHAAVNADGTKAYLPLEGVPSRIAVVDLVGGAVHTIDLGTRLMLRGLAISADGKTLAINGSSLLVTVDVATEKVTGTLPLGAAHVDVAFSNDGRRVYLARTVDGEAGSLSIASLDPLRVQGKIRFTDIGPWVIAVRPQAAYAQAH